MEADDTIRRRAINRDLASTVNKQVRMAGQSGWTIRAYGPNMGEKAKDSYAAALPKKEVEEQLTGGITSRALTRFQRKYKTLLQQDTWHGGWLPKKGKGAQDVVEVFPRTEEGFKTAYSKGVRHNQEAIGELGPTGAYTGTFNLPAEIKDRSLWGRGSFRDVRKPRVEQTPNKVVITPSHEEMIDVYASTEKEVLENLAKNNKK